MDEAPNYGNTGATIGHEPPDPRFFVGFAQWACEDERPERARVHAQTDPHSPPKYRPTAWPRTCPSSGFSCEPGQPMVKEPGCRVW